MTVSGILSETLAVMRATLWVLFPIAFAGTAALEIITALIFVDSGAAQVGTTAGQEGEQAVVALFSRQALLAQIPAIIIGTYMNLLVIRIAWAFIQREPLDVGLWARQMVNLVFPGVIVTLAALLLIGVGLAAFIIPGLLVTALIIVILPVLVIEGLTGPVSLILRSRELTQEQLLLLCGLLILLLFAAFGFLAIATPLILLAESFAAGVLLATAIGAVLSIFSAVLPTVIYRQLTQGG